MSLWIESVFRIIREIEARNHESSESQEQREDLEHFQGGKYTTTQGSRILNNCVLLRSF